MGSRINFEYFKSNNKFYYTKNSKYDDDNELYAKDENGNYDFIHKSKIIPLYKSSTDYNKAKLIFSNMKDKEQEKRRSNGCNCGR